MIEAVLVTLLPVGFLIILLGGGVLFLRRNIEQNGEAPINRTIFYSSKYSVIALWGAMVAKAGASACPLRSTPFPPDYRAVLLGLRFALLYLVRFKMGDSFRLGTPQEDTSLKTDKIFRLSEEPDVCRHVCNDGCICSLHTEPGRHPAGSVRHRRPPPDRSCRRETPAQGVWTGVSGLLQPYTAVHLTARHFFFGKNISYLMKAELLFEMK